MSSSFCYSVIGHILIGALFFLSIPTFEKKQDSFGAVPIFIDLKNVGISAKTNLPPNEKTRLAEEKKSKRILSGKSEKKTIEKKFSEKKVVENIVTPKEVELVQKVLKMDDAAKVVEPEVKKIKVPDKAQIKSKKEIKKIDKVSLRSKPKLKPVQKQDDGLDSLLASVEKMRKNHVKQKTNYNKSEVSDLVSGILQGIDAGSMKSLGSKLTVSQIDFIASKVRKHWNLDAGVEGIYDMIIEVRISLEQDGRVSNVEFLNKSRYDSDSAFRSVAQSAKRAILICDKLGNESPFRMLALKYPQNYSDWKKIRLRFNPLDGGVS